MNSGSRAALRAEPPGNEIPEDPERQGSIPRGRGRLQGGRKPAGTVSSPRLMPLTLLRGPNPPEKRLRPWQGSERCPAAGGLTAGQGRLLRIPARSAGGHPACQVAGSPCARPARAPRRDRKGPKLRDKRASRPDIVSGPDPQCPADELCTGQVFRNTRSDPHPGQRHRACIGAGSASLRHFPGQARVQTPRQAGPDQDRPFFDLSGWNRPARVHGRQG